MSDTTELIREASAPQQPQRPDKVRSLWSDAWRQLLPKPADIASSVIILFIVLISIAPALFSSPDA